MHVRQHPTTELNLPGNPWSFETKILLCSQEGLKLLAHLRLLPEQCVCYRGVNPPWHQGGKPTVALGGVIVYVHGFTSEGEGIVCIHQY